MWIVPLHHVHYIQSLPEGTAPLFRMFPAAWLNSKPSSWQLEKWQNFCEAALSVSYNRRFLWNDFVKLTTLFGFFFCFGPTHFVDVFKCKRPYFFREFANYSKSMDIWYTVQVFFPKVLQLELISFFIHIKSNYSTSKCTYSNNVHFVMYIFYPQNPPFAGKPWTSPTLFSLPFLESPLTCQMTVDRGKAAGTHRAMWRGVRFRRFLWANGGRQGDDLVVVAQ